MTVLHMLLLGGRDHVCPKRENKCTGVQLAFLLNVAQATREPAAPEQENTSSYYKTDIF